MIISDKLTQFLVCKLQEEVETLGFELNKSRENSQEWMDYLKVSEDNNTRLIKENNLLKYDLNNLDMGYDILKEDHQVQHDTLNLQAKSIISLQGRLEREDYVYNNLDTAYDILKKEYLELESDAFKLLDKHQQLKGVNESITRELLELRKYKADKESAKNVVGELMEEAKKKGGKREGAGRKKVVK